MIITDKSQSTFVKGNKSILWILKVQTETLKAIHDFMYSEDLTQLMPVILSSITDPLSHSVFDAKIKYINQELQLTKSMIFHKQIALARLGIKGLYIMSPNVRLEMTDLKDSGKHLLEFTQLDIELKEISGREFMAFIERLLLGVFDHINATCRDELTHLGVEVLVPELPFKVYSSGELEEQFGENYECEASIREKDPFWIIDHEREFYDKEDPKNKGHYINYDLVYPEGYGEALSGGERDYEYKILIRKIRERSQDVNSFKYYLEQARKGKLIASTGGGLGIERLIRFLTKSQHIEDVTLFPKVPGKEIVL